MAKTQERKRLPGELRIGPPEGTCEPLKRATDRRLLISQDPKVRCLYPVITGYNHQPLERHSRADARRSSAARRGSLMEVAMANYVAAVPKKLQENYHIALQSRTWGVEQAYENKMRPLRTGDLLLFLVENAFRSLHRVEGVPYVDQTPLWPDKNGDLFPHRVKISDPIATGEVDLNGIAPKISFLKDLDRPYGAFQGRNGVLNERMTEEDMAVIRGLFATPVRREIKPDPEETRRVIERQSIILSLYKDDLDERILELLPAKGLRILPDGRRVTAGPETIDAIAADSRGNLVVVAINRGLAPQEMLLKILRQMSWTRQNRAEGKDVRGMIITEAADRVLLDLAGEVPNISLRYYRLTLELADEPPHANGRVA